MSRQQVAHYDYAIQGGMPHFQQPLSSAYQSNSTTGATNRPPVMPKKTQSSRNNLKSETFLFGNTQYQINCQSAAQHIQSDRVSQSSLGNHRKKQRPNSHRDTIHYGSTQDTSRQPPSTRSQQSSSTSKPTQHLAGSRSSRSRKKAQPEGAAVNQQLGAGLVPSQASHQMASVGSLKKRNPSSRTHTSGSANMPEKHSNLMQNRQSSQKHISGTKQNHPLIVINKNDKQKKDVIASLEQINDHLDNLMRPLNELATNGANAKATSQNSNKALNHKRPQTTRNSKKHQQGIKHDKLEERQVFQLQTDRGEQYSTQLRKAGLQGGPGTMIDNIYEDQRQNFNTINIGNESNEMLIPERLSNGCTNLRTLQQNNGTSSYKFRHSEVNSESLESDRNFNTIPLQILPPNSKGSTNTSQNCTCPSHEYNNHTQYNHNCNMKILDQVLIAPKSSLESEIPDLHKQLKTMHIPMTLPKDDKGKGQHVPRVAVGTPEEAPPANTQSNEIDQIMDRYRDMCKDLDKDIKQAAQKIKKNLFLNNTQDDDSKHHPSAPPKQPSTTRPPIKREKRNLLENSDPFNNDRAKIANAVVPGSRPKDIMIVENSEMASEVNGNNLVSSNLSNKFQFKFNDESDLKDSMANSCSNSSKMASQMSKTADRKDQASAGNYFLSQSSKGPSDNMVAAHNNFNQFDSKMKDLKQYKDLRSDFIKSPSVAEISLPKQPKQHLGTQNKHAIIQQNPQNRQQTNDMNLLNQTDDIEVDVADIRLSDKLKEQPQRDKVPRSLLSQISSAVSGIQAGTNSNSTEALDTCKNINNYNSKFAFSVEESLLEQDQQQNRDFNEKQEHHQIKKNQENFQSAAFKQLKEQDLEESIQCAKPNKMLFEDIGSIQKVKQVTTNNYLYDSGFSQSNQQMIKDMQISQISKITNGDQLDNFEISDNFDQRKSPHLTSSQMGHYQQNNGMASSNAHQTNDGHIFLKKLNDNNFIKQTMGSSECQSVGQNSQGTDANSQNTADFTKDIFSPGKDHNKSKSSNMHLKFNYVNEESTLSQCENHIETPQENVNRIVQINQNQQQNIFQDDQSSPSKQFYEQEKSSNADRVNLIDSDGSRKYNENLKQDTLGITPTSVKTDSRIKKIYQEDDEDNLQHSSPNFEQKITFQRKHNEVPQNGNANNLFGQTQQNLPNQNSAVRQGKNLMELGQGSQGPQQASSSKMLRQALSLSLQVICQLSQSIQRQNPEAPAASSNLDQLEDIDSLPSLIDLLAFIEADEDNLMVRNSRIQQILKTCSQQLHNQADDSIYLEASQIQLQTERSDRNRDLIGQPNSANSDQQPIQQQTSVFANMKQYASTSQNESQSRRNNDLNTNQNFIKNYDGDRQAPLSTGNNIRTNEENKGQRGETSIRNGDKQVQMNEYQRNMPNILIEQNRCGTFENDEQPSSIREQQPILINNQSQSAVTETDQFFRDSDQSQVVVQVQADISEFRNVNHVSSPIENPRLYEDEDSHIHHQDLSDTDRNQNNVRSFQPFDESRCMSGNGNEAGVVSGGFGAMLEESPQLKSMNRNNIQIQDQRFEVRSPNAGAHYGTFSSNAVCEMQIVETFRNTSKDRHNNEFENTGGSQFSKMSQHMHVAPLPKNLNKTLEQVTEEDILPGNFSGNREYEQSDEVLAFNNYHNHAVNIHKKNQSNLIKPLELSKISAVQEDKQSYSKNASVIYFGDEPNSISQHEQFQHQIIANGKNHDKKQSSNMSQAAAKKYQTVDVDQHQINDCYIDNKEPDQLLTLRNQEIFQFSQEEQNMRDSNLFSQNHERSFTNNLDGNTFDNYGEDHNNKYNRVNTSNQIKKGDVPFRMNIQNNDSSIEQTENQEESFDYNQSPGQQNQPPRIEDEKQQFAKYKDNCKQILDNLTMDSQEEGNNVSNMPGGSPDPINQFGLNVDFKRNSIGKNKRNKNTTCRLSQSDLIFSRQIMSQQSSQPAEYQGDQALNGANMIPGQIANRDMNIHILEEHYCEQQSFSSQFKEGISQTESHSHSQSQSQSHSHLNSIQSAIRKINNDGKKQLASGFTGGNDYQQNQHQQFVSGWESSQNRPNNCKILQYERIESEKEDTNMMASSQGMTTQNFGQYPQHQAHFDLKQQSQLSPTCSSPQHESGEVQLKEIKGKTMELDVGQLKNNSTKESDLHQRTGKVFLKQFQSEDQRKNSVFSNQDKIIPKSTMQDLIADNKNPYMQQKIGQQIDFLNKFTHGSYGQNLQSFQSTQQRATQNDSGKQTSEVNSKVQPPSNSDKKINNDDQTKPKQEQQRKQINLVCVSEISSQPKNDNNPVFSSGPFGGEEETNDEFSQSCASVSQFQIDQLLQANKSSNTNTPFNQTANLNDDKVQNILNVGGAAVKLTQMKTQNNLQNQHQSKTQKLIQKDSRMLVNEPPFMFQKEKTKQELLVEKQETNQVIQGLIQTYQNSKTIFDDQEKLIKHPSDASQDKPTISTSEAHLLQMNSHPSEMTNSNSNSVLRPRAPSTHSIQQKRLQLIQEPSQLSSIHNDTLNDDVVMHQYAQGQGGRLTNLSSARMESAEENVPTKVFKANQFDLQIQNNEIEQIGKNLKERYPIKRSGKVVNEVYESETEQSLVVGGGCGDTPTSKQDDRDLDIVNQDVDIDLDENVNPIPFVFKDIESENEDRIMPYQDRQNRRR